MGAALASDMIQSLRTAVREPSFTLETTPEAYRFEAVLPELAAETLHVRLDTGTLRITARCEAKALGDGFFSYVRERRVDERFDLPGDAISTGWLIERCGERVVVTIGRLGDEA